MALLARLRQCRRKGKRKQNTKKLQSVVKRAGLLSSVLALPKVELTAEQLAARAKEQEEATARAPLPLPLVLRENLKYDTCAHAHTRTRVHTHI